MDKGNYDPNIMNASYMPEPTYVRDNYSLEKKFGARKRNPEPDRSKFII